MHRSDTDLFDILVPLKLHLEVWRDPLGHPKWHQICVETSESNTLKTYYLVFWIHPCRDHCIYFLNLISSCLPTSLACQNPFTSSAFACQLLPAIHPSIIFNIFLLGTVHYKMQLQKLTDKFFFNIVYIPRTRTKSSPLMNWSTVRTLL